MRVHARKNEAARPRGQSEGALCRKKEGVCEMYGSEYNTPFGSPFLEGQDKTRQDKTRQDKTRQDKTRQDKTRQDNLTSESDKAKIRSCMAGFASFAFFTEKSSTGRAAGISAARDLVELFFCFFPAKRRRARGGPGTSWTRRQEKLQGKAPVHTNRE